MQPLQQNDGWVYDRRLISGSMTGSLTQEVVVAYARGDDPTDQDWDDWLLRMTFRISFFLRANRDNPEPDLAILNAF